MCLLPLLAGRTFGAIKLGILNWTGPWGSPESMIADREKGIGGEPMKVWLEENHSKLLPIPPAEGSRHFQARIIDVHSKAVRATVHRIDSSFIERKVKATAEELFSLVAWTANTARGRTGVCAAQAAMGMIPRDPLQTQAWDPLTSSQMSHEDQMIEKIRFR